MAFTSAALVSAASGAIAGNSDAVSAGASNLRDEVNENWKAVSGMISNFGVSGRGSVFGGCISGNRSDDSNSCNSGPLDSWGMRYEGMDDATGELSSIAWDVASRASRIGNCCAEMANGD